MPAADTDRNKGPMTIREAFERAKKRAESNEGTAEFLEAKTTQTATCETCGQTIQEEDE